MTCPPHGCGPALKSIAKPGGVCLLLAYNTKPSNPIEKTWRTPAELGETRHFLFYLLRNWQRGGVGVGVGEKCSERRCLGGGALLNHPNCRNTNKQKSPRMHSRLDPETVGPLRLTEAACAPNPFACSQCNTRREPTRSCKCA